MKIFLSYASEHRNIAGRINLILIGEGHDVFFDRADLPEAEGFDARIRRALQASDLFIFLLSPQSVEQGSYARTELRIAENHWPNPEGRVLPVVLKATPTEDVPAYLRAVTWLEPEGDLAAEVAAVVARIADKQGISLPSRRILLATGISAVVLAVTGYFLLTQDNPTSDPENFTFFGIRANSGSVFERLDNDERQRFGSQDTKHNAICWIGRRTSSMSTGFLDVHMLLPGIPLDRVQVQKANFSIQDLEVEGDEVTRWLGPLMLLALDYGELDADDVENILERGQTIRSYENLSELQKQTDITSVVQNLFQRREEHLRLVLVFPGRAVGQEQPGIVRFEPGKAEVSLEYIVRR